LSHHFCSHKYHKIVNNFIFEQVKNIILAKALRSIVFFTEKFVTKLSKIWVWDPGSGKILFPDPGSRVIKAADPGSATQTATKVNREKMFYLPAKSFVFYAPFPYILQCTHILSSKQNEKSTYLGPGLGVLDEPYSAKPAQRSSHNGPPDYIG
jgi:hypothetical protein